MRSGTSSGLGTPRFAKTSERGFVLVAALVIALLYLGLMELLLIDGTRSLKEAQRVRARLVASTLAENGAELAARQLVTTFGANVVDESEQGSVEGKLERTGDQFVITGKATTSGVAASTAEVQLQGRIVGSEVTIDYALHRP